MPALIVFIAIILVSCFGGCASMQPVKMTEEQLAIDYHKIAVLKKHGEYELAALIQKRVNRHITSLR